MHNINILNFMDKEYFESVIAKYLNEMTYVRGLSLVTIQGYKNDLSTLFLFLTRENLGDFSYFDRMSVRRYLSWLDRSGYSRSSIVRKLSVLRNFFRWLNKKDYIHSDPVPLRVPMKKPKLLPKVLSEDEVNRLSDAIISYNKNLKNKDILMIRDLAILELIYGSGLRVSELVALDMEDVDLDELKATVVGKGRKERIVLFGEITKKFLSDYVLQSRRNILKDLRSTEEAFFISNRGTRLSVRSVQHRLKN